MAERTVELKFRVDDTGSLKLEQIKGNIGKVATEVTKMDKALQIIKWDSIINLGERAIQAAERIYSFGKSIASAANDIQRQANIMGVTTDEYQKLTYAAKMGDLEISEFSTGIGIFSTKLEEAAKGTGDVAGYLKAMGIDIDNTAWKALSLSEKIGEVAEQFKSWEEGERKIAISRELFGRSGTAWIEFLNQGKEGIAGWGEKLVKMKGVLGEVTLAAGSAAENQFKDLDTQINVMKISLAPLILDFATFATKIANAATQAGIFSDKSREMELKNLKAWLEYGISEGASEKFITDYKRRIAELEKEIGIKTLIKPKLPPPVIEKTIYDKDAFKDWLEDWNKGITAMEELGVKAQAVSQAEIRMAIENTEIIKQKWLEKKITGLDYYNSMKAASELMKKATGDEGDQTKQLLNILDDLDERIKSISPEDPDRTKKINKFTDEWIEARGKILNAFKTPMQVMADIKPMERELEKGITAYQKFVKEIENNPPKIKIENFGSPSLTPSPELTGRPTFFPDTEANVNFTATGMSPKIPLGDAFTKIMSNFKTMEEKTSAMEATISFAELSNELRGLQKQYNLYEKMAQERMELLRSSTYSWANPEMNWMMKEVRGFQQDILEQMKIPQLKLAQQKYLMGFPGAEEEFYNLFRTHYNFQRGTDYVPKTGLALVHQGEKIIPANQNHIAMGGITFNINGTQNPRAVAEEIAEILEYKRNGRLEKAIQRVRS